MPFKRKLRADSSDVAEDQSKRQKHLSDSEDQGKVVDINSEVAFKEIIAYLFEQEDHEGRLLHEMFDVLPNREEFPVYYEVITQPIDLKAIKKKISSHQYERIEELEKDVILLVDNTHKFNEPRSQISKDATVLKRAFISKKNEILKRAKKAKVKTSRSQSTESSENLDESNEQDESNTKELTETQDLKEEKEVEEMDESMKKEESSSLNSTDDGENKNKQKKPKLEEIKVTEEISSSPNRIENKKDDGLIDQSVDPTVFTILYNMIVSHTDNTGKPLAEPFLRLPLRRTHQDYYDMIKRPLSLTKLRTKIKAGYYSDLNILEKDFNVLFNNAIQYYAPGSYQHAAANVLQRFMIEKKQEMERSQEYLAMREFMPKRGRPKLVKGENGEIIRTPSSKRSKMQLDDVFYPNDPISLKKRLTQLYSCVYDYKDSEGRCLSTMFRELPNEKEYPEYYKVIMMPIDLKIIHEKLEDEGYKAEDEFIGDLEVMFQNARHFNEEGSEIYEDSITLEKALKKKRRWLNHVSVESKSPMVKVARQTNMSPSTGGRRKGVGLSASKCQELVYFIFNYTDETGRNLAEPFQRVPSRQEYPDYYQLIKKPIDLSYILSRVTKYSTLEDMEQDLLLMFDNACTYNEPDSQIYKDSLTLLRAMFKKKKEINPNMEVNVPDVQLLVQKLLKSLYDNTMNYKDEEGRLYCDSLLEIEATLRDNDEVLSPLLKSSRKPVSLSIIGQLLNLGLYKRVDQLQDDMFSVFKKARRDGTTDSEMYEDACELQIFFITERDRLCKDGLKLQSRALHTMLKSVQTEIDLERKRKQFSEKQDESRDDTDKKSQVKELNLNEEELTYLKTLTANNIVYNIGDYAYLKTDNKDNSELRQVFSVDKIWETKDKRKGILGCAYYWPEATFHLASRRFLEKELFRAPRTSYISSDRLIGRCYVMNVKEYATHIPEGFDEKDVYVCESRYNAKLQSFKKIKHFGLPATHITMVTRKEPLILKRSSDNTASQEDKKVREEIKQIALTSADGYEFDTPKHIEIDVPNKEEGHIYYERFSTDSLTIKIGDGVYVESDEGYNLMLKVNRIFKTIKTDKVKVQGNWCLLPEDTKHSLTQLFGEPECFESNAEGVASVEKIKGKFATLNLRDYQLSRPTEVSEKDIYLCITNYNEEELKCRKNAKGSKRLQLSLNSEDEHWYFEQPVVYRKRPSQWLVYTGNLTELENKSKVTEEEILEEAIKQFNDKQIKEIDNITDNNENDTESDDKETKEEKKWENLSEDEKNKYLSDSEKILDERYLHVFDCGWEDCDYQYEDLQDLMVHVMEGSHFHKPNAGKSYRCLWRGCCKKEDDADAERLFNTHSLVVRHIREVHIKEGRRRIDAQDKSKFYFPRHQACDDGLKIPSDGGESDRPSSHGSSLPSLSPTSTLMKNPIGAPIQPPNNITPGGQPMFPNIGAPSGPMGPGFVPPFRLPNQLNQQQALMQQQIYQQQMMLQARGQILRHHQTPPVSTPTASSQSVMNPVGTPSTEKFAMLSKAPPIQDQATAGQGSGGLSVEQQQMLLAQVQRQQQQIQQLQQQVQLLQQQKSAPPPPPPVEKMPPIFIAPPASTQKIRHSEVYLRYIEGMRDNQRVLSNWSEQAENHPQTPPVNQLPTHWLNNSNHGYDNVTDALWALRDYMLKDSITLSKLV